MYLSNSPSDETLERSPLSVRSEPATLLEKYQKVRAFTELLAAPLSAEDQMVQVDWFASPTKWHLAHVTWFFETFVLAPHLPGYKVFHPAFRVLFNSYYNAVGEQFPQFKRGTLSRPTLDEVMAYRGHVDSHMADFLSKQLQEKVAGLRDVIILGLNHEQQHQELLLTDIKYAFAHNPMYPVYRENSVSLEAETALNWCSFEGGVVELGTLKEGFFFDNEAPRHRAFLEPFQLSSRLISNAEYIEFMEDDGYKRPELWLDLGWSTVQAEGWKAPLYWAKKDDVWWHYTLGGFREVEAGAPVCHVSYFEADAFARWKGAHLPTEAQWESVASKLPLEGHFAERQIFHPQAVTLEAAAPLQMYGDVWEWTNSAYLPYPGYRSVDGALGEYNGKFMSNQMVLRGGSCATSQSHIRSSYRNFFGPQMRWQFQGIRLAKTFPVTP